MSRAEAPLRIRVHPLPDKVRWPEAGVAPEVRIQPQVLWQAREHAEAWPGTEVGGLLLGEVDPGLCLVEVSGILAAESTDAGPAHVTFSHETWRRLREGRLRVHPGLAPAGWYHSHPGFGPFLSRQDLDFHSRIFGRHPWCVALVLDPTTGSQALLWPGPEGFVRDNEASWWIEHLRQATRDAQTAGSHDRLRETLRDGMLFRDRPEAIEAVREALGRLLGEALPGLRQDGEWLAALELRSVLATMGECLPASERPSVPDESALRDEAEAHGAALRHGTPLLRSQAAAALEDLGPEALETLAEASRSDSHPVVQRAAAAVMERIRRRFCNPPLTAPGSPALKHGSGGPASERPGRKL